MASIMQSAIKAGEEEDELKIEILSRLQTENKGLRELLGISSSMNSMMLNSADKTDASVQTETPPADPEEKGK